MSAGLPVFRKGIKTAISHGSGTKSLAYKALNRCRTFTLFVVDRLVSMMLCLD